MSNLSKYYANVYKHAPNADSDTVDRLASIARSLHRLDEKSCNGYADYQGNWDEAAELRAEKRETRLEQKAQQLANELGAKLYQQGDPRGWPLYLYWPDNKGYDDPGAEGK